MNAQRLEFDFIVACVLFELDWAKRPGRKPIDIEESQERISSLLTSLENFSPPPPEFMSDQFSNSDASFRAIDIHEQCREWRASARQMSIKAREMRMTGAKMRAARLRRSP